jgi:hypothetical protein
MITQANAPSIQPDVSALPLLSFPVLNSARRVSSKLCLQSSDLLPRRHSCRSAITVVYAQEVALPMRSWLAIAYGGGLGVADGSRKRCSF